MYFFHIYTLSGFCRVAFSHLVTYFKSSVSCQHSQASVSWSMTCSLRWDVRRVCAGISPLKGSLTGVLVSSLCAAPLPSGPTPPVLRPPNVLHLTASLPARFLHTLVLGNYCKVLSVNRPSTVKTPLRACSVQIH